MKYDQHFACTGCAHWGKIFTEITYTYNQSWKKIPGILLQPVCRSPNFLKKYLWYSTWKKNTHILFNFLKITSEKIQHQCVCARSAQLFLKLHLLAQVESLSIYLIRNASNFRSKLQNRESSFKIPNIECVAELRLLPL